MENKLKMTEKQALDLCKENKDVCLVQKSGCEKKCDQPYKCLYRTLKQKGYIIEDKPLIVHNVMSHKGKNYLLQKINSLESESREGCCSNCSIAHMSLEERENFKRSETCRQNEAYYYWKSFEDIQITDELACMRKDVGDIYLKGSISHLMILSQVLDKDNVIIYVPKAPKAFKVQRTFIHEDLRLATAEELQEYFKREKE